MGPFLDVLLSMLASYVKKSVRFLYEHLPSKPLILVRTRNLGPLNSTGNIYHETYPSHNACLS